MAAGDLTISRTVKRFGRFVVEGSCEVDDTRRAFALVGTQGYVFPGSFVATGDDDAMRFECDYNANAAGTSTNGTVAIISDIKDAKTLNFQAEILM